MMPIVKTALQTRVAVLGLALSFATYNAQAVIVAAVSLQAGAEVSNNQAKFTGTWHWMLKGQSVATMIFTPSEKGLQGSLTTIKAVQVDNDGTVLMIEPGDSTTPMTKISIDGSVLHFTVKDEDDTVECVVTLKDDQHAEVQVSGPGAPAMKPIMAQKVS